MGNEYTHRSAVFGMSSKRPQILLQQSHHVKGRTYHTSYRNQEAMSMVPGLRLMFGKFHSHFPSGSPMRVIDTIPSEMIMHKVCFLSKRG